MATIDSAIIKALVEHIGLNPDNVGDVGNLGNKIIPVEWSAQFPTSKTDSCLVFPVSTEIKRGDILVLSKAQTSDGPISTSHDNILICTHVDTELVFQLGGNFTKTYTFKKDNVKKIWYCLDITCNSNLSSSMFQTVPDNITTGLFRYDNVTTLTTCIIDILYHLCKSVTIVD